MLRDFCEDGFNLIHDGFAKVWRNEKGYEIVQSTDAISLLVYVRDLKKIVFVGQERLPMMGTVNADSRGLTWDLIAGRLDKEGMSPVMIAVNEALEEAGVTVAPEDIKFMNGGKPVAQSAGILTERIYLTYAVVDSSQLADQIRYGDKEEGEDIIRALVPIDKLPMNFDSGDTMASVMAFLRLLERGEIE